MKHFGIAEKLQEIGEMLTCWFEKEVEWVSVVPSGAVQSGGTLDLSIHSSHISGVGSTFSTV